MNQMLNEVFNTYNVNILFTVATLPSRVSLGLPPAMPMNGGTPQSNPILSLTNQNPAST